MGESVSVYVHVIYVQIREIIKSFHHIINLSVLWVTFFYIYIFIYTNIYTISYIHISNRY